MKSGIDGMITTIGEDVKDLEGYAELQKIRYPGRFDFEIDADENCTIMRFLGCYCSLWWKIP